VVPVFDKSGISLKSCRNLCVLHFISKKKTISPTFSIPQNKTKTTISYNIKYIIYISLLFARQKAK